MIYLNLISIKLFQSLNPNHNPNYRLTQFTWDFILILLLNILLIRN